MSAAAERRGDLDEHLPEDAVNASDRESLAASAAYWLNWLTQSALPMWARSGVDRGQGGFHEKIDLTGQPVEEARRARVVARQIYVFATAARRHWFDGADAIVVHGLDFLLGRMRLPDGFFAASVRPDGAVVDGRFDLYEHAFILFALAEACRGRPDRDGVLRPQAEALLANMRGRYGRVEGGFEESVPPTVPLKSNPHMHLFEAAMAWVGLSSGASKVVWSTLIDELADLCQTRFIDARSGALREHFDRAWRPMADESGALVEPGHQFEWAWLLMRYAELAGRPDARNAAVRLLEIGERDGVDRSRGVAVDALDDHLRVTADTAKLWPQTERIKAWHAACRAAADSDEHPRAQRHRLEAANGLALFLLPEPAGLWREQMRADGSFVSQDCRASSLYHIVCALDVAFGDAFDAAVPGHPS